jgi:hypothetical protein
MPRLYRNDDVAELMRRDMYMLEMKVRWRMTYREIGTIYGIWHSLVWRRLRAIPEGVREKAGWWMAEQAECMLPGLTDWQLEYLEWLWAVHLEGSQWEGKLDA